MSFTESLEGITRLNQNGLLSAHPTWGRVPLGLVFVVENGFPFESRHFNSLGEGMPLLRIRDVVRGSTETHYSGKFDQTFVVNPGDIVVGMDGDFKCRAWRGGPALLNQRVCRLRPRSDAYPPTLLPHVLQGYLDAINAKTSAITVKHLSSRTIEDIPLPLPPRDEQGRIVEAIDSYLTRLDAAVASLGRVKAKLKAYRASVLKAAVEGRLVPTEASLARAENRSYESAEALLARILKEGRRRWEEAELAKLKAAGKTPKDDKWKAKHEEPAALDTRKLPDLPEGWCWATLEQLGSWSSGGTPSRSRPDFYSGTIPWVKTGELSDRDVWAADECISAAGLENSSAKVFPVGTLLIAMYGATIGMTGRLAVKAATNQACAALLPNDSNFAVIPYVQTFLISQRPILRQVGQGGAQPNISQAILKSWPVPLPPLAEQQRIVQEVARLVSVASAAEDQVQLDAMRIARLKRCVLRWAFEGKLVDQDPTDEPAERLLARIRAERAAVTPTKKSRGPRARGAA